MRKLHEIASDLKELLSAEFMTVQISAGGRAEQFRAELEVMPPCRMPGVIITFDHWELTTGGTLRECSFSLLLADRFTAGSDERALSMFEASEKLNALFPPHGRQCSGVVFYPGQCAIVQADTQYDCIAFRVTAKQGISK